MQRSWVMPWILATGLLAQAPSPEPPSAPVAQAPKPEPPAAPAPEAAKPVEAKAFEQLRPSQRKLVYTLHRAALSAHELATYRSHPRVVEVRTTLGELLAAKPVLPEKAATALPAVEAYLSQLRANHGLYDATGAKLLLGGTWKDLLVAARAAAKVGHLGLEPRLLKLKGLLFDAKVDAVAPTWAEPEAPAKGKKAKAAKALGSPEGFAEQKAITALWVKRAQAWVENTPQEVEVNGEKKSRRLPDPVQTKALNELLAWLDREDLVLLRDPAFGWLDLRRLGAVPGASLLARSADLTAGKAPEGVPGELALLPTFEPVLGDSKFAPGEEKRAVLVEVKQGPAPAAPAEQSALFEKLGRSRELDVR